MHFGAFFQSFVLMTDNKDGGGGDTAGGRNRQAAQHSVAVCEQISEMKLTNKNAAVQTGSKRLLAEVIILFYFIFGLKPGL